MKSGVIDMKVTPELKMTTKEVGIRSEMGIKLDGLEVQSDLSAQFKTGFLEQCSNSAVVKIPLGIWKASAGVFDGGQKNPHVELGLDYKNDGNVYGTKLKTDGADSHAWGVSGSSPLVALPRWKASLSGSASSDLDNAHSVSLLLSNKIGRKSQWKVDLGLEMGTQSDPKGTLGVVYEFGE